MQLRDAFDYERWLFYPVAPIVGIVLLVLFNALFTPVGAFLQSFIGVQSAASVTTVLMLLVTLVLFSSALFNHMFDVKPAPIDDAAMLLVTIVVLTIVATSFPVASVFYSAVPWPISVALIIATSMTGVTFSQEKNIFVDRDINDHN